MQLKEFLRLTLDKHLVKQIAGKEFALLDPKTRQPIFTTQTMIPYQSDKQSLCGVIVLSSSDHQKLGIGSQIKVMFELEYGDQEDSISISKVTFNNEALRVLRDKCGNELDTFLRAVKDAANAVARTVSRSNRLRIDYVKEHLSIKDFDTQLAYVAIKILKYDKEEIAKSIAFTQNDLIHLYKQVYAFPALTQAIDAIEHRENRTISSNEANKIVDAIVLKAHKKYRVDDHLTDQLVGPIDTLKKDIAQNVNLPYIANVCTQKVKQSITSDQKQFMTAMANTFVKLTEDVYKKDRKDSIKARFEPNHLKQSNNQPLTTYLEKLLQDAATIYLQERFEHVSPVNLQIIYQNTDPNLFLADQADAATYAVKIAALLSEKLGTKIVYNDSFVTNQDCLYEVQLTAYVSDHVKHDSFERQLKAAIDQDQRLKIPRFDGETNDNGEADTIDFDFSHLAMR